MKDKILFFIGIAGFVILGLRFVSSGPENAWVCSSGRWVKHGNPTTSMPEAPCGEKTFYEGQTISWVDAENLIKNCKVERIFQNHSLEVMLDLKSNIRVMTTEPVIDDVFKINSSSGCKNVILSTE